MPARVPRTVVLTEPVSVSVCSDCEIEWFLSFTDKGENSHVFLCRILETLIQPEMHYIRRIKGLTMSEAKRSHLCRVETSSTDV